MSVSATTAQRKPVGRALDAERRDPEPEEVDDEDPRDRAEHVDVDRRQEAQREEHRARQAAQDREHQAEDEDQHLGDQEQLDVDDEELEDRAIPDELAVIEAERLGEIPGREERLADLLPVRAR